MLLRSQDRDRPGTRPGASQHPGNRLPTSHLAVMKKHADLHEPMIDRARKIAAGLADAGLTHAEELLRRMSPEGREQARREREARARRQKRLMVRLVIALSVALLAWAMLAAVAPPGVALAAASALMLLLTVLIFMRADGAAPGREALAGAALPGLAEEATAWLAAQRRGLPPAALQLTDSMSCRLDALAPQLGRLDPLSPAALAVGKLIAEELPDLIDGWRAVPISGRSAPRADGRTPDDHLINGLQLIEAELARTGERLGSEPADAIAVLGRYLELKYDQDGLGSRR